MLKFVLAPDEREVMEERSCSQLVFFVSRNPFIDGPRWEFHYTMQI